MKRRMDRFDSPRRGQIIIAAAFSLLVLCGMAAMAIDVGYIFCTQARLQNAADAAALAATQKLVEQRNNKATEQAARTAAVVEAAAIVNANWNAAGWTVVFGTYQNKQFAARGPEVAATAVQAVASRDSAAPGGRLALFFAPVAKITQVDVSAKATCVIFGGIRTIRGNLVPFAVYEPDIVPAGQTMDLYASDKAAPGNFGLLNFNGGSLGTPELQDWIRYGYDGEITIDPELNYTLITGDTGWRSAITPACQSRLGDILIVCVYDQVTAQGSNATFRIPKFLAVKLTAVNVRGGSGLESISCEVQGFVNVPNAEYDSAINDNLVKIMLAG
jgi:Flp pilus assembly protein TadG